MKYLPYIVFAIWLVPAASFVVGQESIKVIADFESLAQIAKQNTTHKATVSLKNDTPKNSGKSAMMTVVDKAADAKNHFGTGIQIPATDLSKAHEIRFWIKTDIESDFNLQIHTGNRVSVFRFSTVDSGTGTWTKITAPLAEFRTPLWAKDGKADLTQINRLQLTAFGSGPYDGKYVLLDDVSSPGALASRLRSAGVPAGSKKMEGNSGAAAMGQGTPTVQRGGPIHLKDVAEDSTPKSPPPGFRRLFDGKTLDGWTPKARLPVPKYPGAPLKWQPKGDALTKAKQNTGRWVIEDGAIVGGQDPPGSGKGAYLVSEETFGDFELMMDMKPDWKTDSGFLVRTLPGGSPGMQILVDHRPQGGIGGFYGNGIAGIHGMAFAIDARYDQKGNPIGIIAADPNGTNVELSQKTRDVLSFAAEVDDLLKVWKWGQWNTIKVRCEGRIPKLTTWVNGTKIAVLDMNTVEWENYDKAAIARMLGRKGHISLEVHNNNFKSGMGKDRWWPGAVVRWKNIFIRELE